MSGTRPAATPVAAAPFGCRIGAKRAGIRGHLAIAAEYGARFLVDAPVDRVRLRGRSGGRRRRSTAGPRRGGLPSDVARPTAFTPGRSSWPPVPCGRRSSCSPAVARTPGPATVCGSTRSLPWPASCRSRSRCGRVRSRARDRCTSWNRDPPRLATPVRPMARSCSSQRRRIPAWPGSAFPWTGRADSQAFMERLSFVAPIVSLVGDRGAGRVSLSRTGRPRIDYRIAPNDARTASRAVVEMARISRAAGATSIVAVGTPAVWFGRDGRTDDRSFGRYLEDLAGRSFAPNRMGLFSAHQMGSMPAGGDPATSACDPWGRVRADTAGGPCPASTWATARSFRRPRPSTRR